MSADRPGLLRAGAILMVLFQLAYATQHLVASPTDFSHTEAFHFLNVAIGLFAFAATFSSLVPRFWRGACVAVCAGLMISTTFIDIGCGTFEPLFISIVALVIGVGTLAPWEAGWQASIGWIGLACFFVLEWSRPGLDPHAFMHWLGLFTVVSLAQANTRLQKHYRAQIADKISALELHHRQLRHQIRISEDLAIERESALSRLAEREATLRDIFDSALDLIAVTRYSDGTYVQVNQQFSKVTGYSAEDVIGVSAFELGIWTSAEQRDEFFRELESNGCVRNFEQNFKLKDGTLVPFLLSSVPIEIDGERCVLTTSRDIRDIKATERRLRDSEEKFRQIFEKSSDAIVVTSLDSQKIFEVNEEFVRRTGVTREQAVGSNAVELGFLDGTVRDSVFKQVRDQGFVANIEVQLRLAGSESPVPALISSVRVVISGQNCVINVVRFISDLKQAERRLRESEATLRKILESSPDAVCIHDKRGRYVYVNEEFLRLTGFAREECIGKAFWELGIWPDRESADQFAAEIFKNGEVRNLQTSFRIKSGLMIPSLISGVLVDLDGQQCCMTISRDISDLKDAQFRLHESEASLRRIFESGLDPMAILDLTTGTWADVNQEFCRFHGVTKEDVIGRTDLETPTWADLAERDEFLRRLDSGAVRNMDVVLQTRDGRKIPSLISAVVVELSGRPCCVAMARDISDRLEAERFLRESQATLRKIFDSIADPLCVTDMSDDSYLDVNDAFLSVFGYAREEVIGKHVWEVPPATRPHDPMDDVVKLYSHGEVRNSEATVKTKDGRDVPCLISTVVLELNGMQCGLTIARDISERLEAERTLRQSQTALRKIFDSIADPLTVTDMRAVFVDVNDAFLATTGYTREEIIGKGAWDIPITDWSKLCDPEELFRTGMMRNSEVSMRSKTGSEIPVLVSAVLMQLNGQQCVLTIARDISERKQQELKLQQSERYFRNLIESSSDVILVIDYSGNIVFVGGAGRGELGYTGKDVIGTSGATLVHPDDLQRQAENTRDAFLHPEKVVRSEARIRAADGRWIECEFMGRSTVDPDGNPILITTMRNISERKRAEQELANARDAALAASKAKSEFLSSMSHEIRTPMNAILGMSDLMSETELTAEQRRCLDTVIGNGTALLELINSILDLAKVESGRLSLEKVEFDVVELTEKIADTLAVRAHGKKLEVALRFAPTLPPVLIGDPLRIRQILTNLIGNAIKFTDQGQVLIEVAPNPNSTMPGNLKFSICDTGIGIEDDKLAHIFSAFTQADSSITRRYGGSGLGLAIVERLVTLMGGAVHAESVPGQGSIFSFTVQLGVPETARAAPPPMAAPKMHGLRALLVDDSATSRSIARAMLEAQDAQVIEADSGASGVRAFEEALQGGQPFGLLLVDSEMPEMDGFEMLEQIERSKPSVTPVIVMMNSTGLTSKLPPRKGLGSMNYIVKPLKQRELYAKVNEALTAHEPQEPAANSQLRSAPLSGEVAVVARPLRVLLADDSPDNRLLIRAYLKKTPYTLDEAENGRIAYDQFLAGSYDVVLMDIQMPVLDGYTAVRMIRDFEKTQSLKRTPIIALTASALDDAVRKAKDAGCDLHVSKPVKKATLLEAIANSIESAEAVMN